MARTHEKELPVSEDYRDLLRQHVAAAGRDRIAELAGIDSATVHRNVNEEKLTYSTAMKLHKAIQRAHRDDKRAPDTLPPLPPPFCAVVSQGHFDVCELAGRLYKLDLEKFGKLLGDAIALTQEAERDRVLGAAKGRIANPLPNPAGGGDRGS